MITQKRIVIRVRSRFNVWLVFGLGLSLECLESRLDFSKRYFFPGGFICGRDFFSGGGALSLTGSNLVDNLCQKPSLLPELIQCMLIK